MMMPPCLGPFFLDRDPLPVWSAAAGGAPIYSLCAIAAAATVCCVVYKREKKRFIFNDQLRLVNRSELHHAHHKRRLFSFILFETSPPLLAMSSTPVCLSVKMKRNKKSFQITNMTFVYVHIYIYPTECGCDMPPLYISLYIYSFGLNNCYTYRGISLL